MAGAGAQRKPARGLPLTSGRPTPILDGPASAPGQRDDPARQLDRGLTYRHQGRRLLSLIASVASLPVALALGLPLAVINAAYYRDLRQVFFRQARVGRHGRVFRIWKFRTMRDERSPLSPIPGETQGDEFERYEFERWSEGHGEVTRLGRVLRDSHLDELPQLFNVIMGDMDLVGPRPEMCEVHRWAQRSIPHFHERNQTRPGITGLAQLRHGYAGRDVDAYRRKLQADLEYNEGATLLGDLTLMVRTLVWVVTKKLESSR